MENKNIFIVIITLIIVVAIVTGALLQMTLTINNETVKKIQVLQAGPKHSLEKILDQKLQFTMTEIESLDDTVSEEMSTVIENSKISDETKMITNLI